MPQADAENRNAGFAEVRQLGNDSRVILRVAGTIAQHDTVRRIGEDACCCRGSGNDGQVAV